MEIILNAIKNSPFVPFYLAFKTTSTKLFCENGLETKEMLRDRNGVAVTSSEVFRNLTTPTRLQSRRTGDDRDFVVNSQLFSTIFHCINFRQLIQ